MKIIIEIQGDWENIKLKTGHNTPEEFVKDYFDSANEQFPNILTQGNLSFARVSNNDVIARCTVVEEYKSIQGE